MPKFIYEVDPWTDRPIVIKTIKDNVRLFIYKNIIYFR